MWKSFKLRLVAAILGGILALFLLVLAALHTPPVRRYALKQIVEILGNQGITFDSKSIEYDLFRLTASLRDVTVRSKQAPDLPPLAHADLVRLHLSLRELISGRLYVKDGEINNPSIQLIIDERGRDNIPATPKDDTKKSTTDYLIDYFLVRGGNLRFEDRRQQIRASLPLGQLTVDGNPSTGNHDIKLTTPPAGTVAFQQRSLPLRGVFASLQLQKDAVDVRDFQLGLGDSTLKFAGKLQNFNDPRYDVRADTDLALGSLVDFAGVKQKVNGTVHVALAATGPLNQLKATARLNGDNLALENFDRLNLKAEAAYDSVEQRVRLDSFNIFSPAGTIQGKSDIALNTKAGDSTLNASLRGLDLLRLSTVFASPVRIASRATGNVAARWPALAFEKASGDATLNLTATRSAAAKNVVPLSGFLNAKTAGPRIIIGIPSLRTLNAQASGQIQLLNKRNLSGNVRVQAPGLAATVTGAESLLGKKPGTLLGAPLGGSAVLEAKVGGTVTNPTLAAIVSSPSLQAGNLSGIAVNAALNYTPAGVTISKATVDWQGQQLTATGFVGLKGRAPKLNLHAQTSNVTAQALLAGLGRTDIPVTGNLAINTTVEGTTSNPVVEATVTSTELTAYGETLGDLSAEASLLNDIVNVKRLRLDKPQPGRNGVLEASATYNTKTENFTVKADTDNIKLTSLTLSDGTPVRGEIDLHAAGQGTAQDPTLNAQLSAKGIQYGNQQYGDLAATARVANQEANLTASVPQYRVSGNARVGLKDPNRGTFELHADNTELASLPVKLDQGLEGKISAVVRGSGTIKDYQQGQASIEVSKLDLKWNNQPIRTEGPLVARYENKLLTIDRATVAALDSRLSIDGKLPLDATAGQGAINVDGTINVESVLAYLPMNQPITARGTATIKGTIAGTLKSIDPNLSIALDNGYVSTAALNPPLANIKLQARVRDGALEIQNASADWGVAIFGATGQVPFALLPADLPIELPRRQGPAQFTAELKGLDLATIKGLPENLAGGLSIRVEAQAPKPDLQALTAKVTFPDLHLNLGSYALQQAGTSTISVANGVARVDQFQITGPATDIRLAGTAGLLDKQPLDLRLNGKFDAAIASVFTDAVRARGVTELQAAVTGTVSNPQAQGYLQFTEAQISIPSPRVGIEGLNARFDLAPNRITLSRLEGSVNGGELSGGGSLAYANGEIRPSDIRINAEGVYLDFPEGLKSVSDVRLTARSTAENILIGGEVVITDAGFTDDLNIDRGILAAATASRGVELSEQRNPLLAKTRFDVAVRTDNPIVIDNNLAKAEITADLRVLGNPYETGLSGTLTIEEGGTLRLNEREYQVERGVITFANERKIEPGLDIIATTKAGTYDIRLQISGEPGKTETTLTADPPDLTEPDILALLLTGRTLDQVRGQEFEVARNQVLSYLTGRVGSKLGRSVAGATGLSTVRIEPNLIANETDPSARLTVGQNITTQLNLIYSMDLINSSDQIYVAEYDLSRRFTTRGVRQSDGSFRVDFRHDLRFGGTPESKHSRKQQRKIGNVSILGDTYFSEMKIADKLGAKQGKRYDYFKIRKGVDKVNGMFAKENLLEADIRLKRKVSDNSVDLTLTIDRGPAVDFVYEGIAVGDGQKKKIRKIWEDGVFDTQRAEEAVQSLQAWLVKEDYLKPEIQYSITEPADDRKRVLFDIIPGGKYTGVTFVFEGGEGIDADTLQKLIKQQKLATDVYVKPGRVTELLTRYYQEQGYLDAKVNVPRYDLNPSTHTGQVIFPVAQGPLYRIRSLGFQGNRVIPEADLREALPLPIKEVYKPVLRENSLQRLQELYWEKGYNDVDIDVSTRRDKDGGQVDVIVKLEERRKETIREIVLEGNQNTSENLIRTQLEVKAGDVLNLQKVSNSRRNLYNTGAYSVVEIRREELTGPEDANANEKPVKLTVHVRELQPFQLRYGGYYDTERGPGVILDLANRNSLGSARTAGLRTRYDSQLQEFRFYFTQPLLRRFPVSTTASPFIRQERNPATSTADPFNVDRVGFSIQQEAKFRQRTYVLNYGYRLERTRTYDVGPEPVFDIPQRIAALTSTLTRETRDDILDASRGSFASQAFQWSPESLGSQLRFIRYFGQYYKYIPLQKPKVELFTNQVLRPRLVYAVAGRVGLARGFGGQDVALSERFFAGGGTTVRGFEQNTLGPVGPGRTPLGGNAMLVINNEIRFPIFSLLDGVGFVDVGNVYSRVSDFSFGDVRKAGGFGLRVRTPYVLLRLDYGFKLDLKPGESRSRLFFSIGQAF